MLDTLDTPCLVIDLDVMEANIRRMSERAMSAGLRLRPHTKTHKNPWIASLQVAAGATGITCAKLGEAEVMADAGLDDILIAFPLVGEAKLRRLAALLQRGIRVRTVTDHLETARGLAALGESLGRPVEVLVEVNTGQNRCGLLPGEGAASFALALRKLPGIQVVGLMTHGGHAYAAATPDDLRTVAAEESSQLLQTARLMEQAGMPVQEISVGSTPGSRFLEAWQGATECRPGTYVFNDMTTVQHGAATLEDCALSVLTTVVSRPAADRAVVDAGSKSLALDTCPGRTGFGYVREHPEAVVSRLSEEHGVLLVPQGADPAVGARLRITPNHVCPVVNLFDRAYGIRQGRVEREIVISGRGKVQ